MKEHQVNFEDFKNGLIDKYYTAASERGERGNKDLQVAAGRESYRVLVDGRNIFEGSWAEMAVKIYNTAFETHGKEIAKF